MHYPFTWNIRPVIVLVSSICYFTLVSSFIFRWFTILNSLFSWKPMKIQLFSIRIQPVSLFEMIISRTPKITCYSNQNVIKKSNIYSICQNLMWKYCLIRVSNDKRVVQYLFMVLKRLMMIKRREKMCSYLNGQNMRALLSVLVCLCCVFVSSCLFYWSTHRKISININVKCQNF